MGKNRLRLLFCSNGTNTYDPLFLNRLSKEFETYLVTFLSPEQVFKMDAGIIRLRDFGRPLRIRRMNNLRITLGALWRTIQICLCVEAMNPHILVGSWVTSFGLYVRLTRRRPFVLFAYGMDIVVDPHRSPLHRAITIDVIKSADLVLIDSEVQRRALLSLGCVRDKIVTFPWFDESKLRAVDADARFRQARMDAKYNRCMRPQTRTKLLRGHID